MLKPRRDDEEMLANYQNFGIMIVQGTGLTGDSQTDCPMHVCADPQPSTPKPPSPKP